MLTYRALPAGARAALAAAARVGLACDVGTHSARASSRYEPRAVRATVRGAVPGDVAVVLTLAGFRRDPLHERARDGGLVQWWGWYP